MKTKIIANIFEITEALIFSLETNYTVLQKFLKIACARNMYI